MYCESIWDREDMLVPADRLVDVPGGEPMHVMRGPLLVLLALAAALCVFAIDYLSRLDSAIAVLAKFRFFAAALTYGYGSERFASAIARSS